MGEEISMNLSNKSVLITGGTDGLGLSLARLLVSKGAKVCIIGRNQEKVNKAVKELGNNVTGFVADVSKLRELDSVAKQINNLDILINNAGIWLEGGIADNREEQISSTIDTNLKGVIYATKAFLPLLKKSEETHILNVTSTSGIRGRENQSVYVASKFGVTGFTESLKLELASTNVKVTGFYPGGMKTKLFDKAGTPKNNQDWMDTDKVANIILFMLEQDATMIMDHVVLNKRMTKASN